MIIQGSNNPIVLKLDKLIDTVSITYAVGQLSQLETHKVWELSDIEFKVVDGVTAVVFPMTQSDSLKFKEKLTLPTMEFKWKIGEHVYFTNQISIAVNERKNKTILGEDFSSDIETEAIPAQVITESVVVEKDIPLKNFDALLLGDSQVAQTGSVGWRTYFSAITGCNIYSAALPGATLMDKEGTVLDGNPMESVETSNTISNQVEKVLRNPEDYGDPKLIIISAMVNDVFKGLDLQMDDGLMRAQYFTLQTETEPRRMVALEDLTRQNIPSAMRWATEKLRAKYPRAVIFWCAPNYTALPYTDPYVPKTLRTYIKTVSDYQSTLFIDTILCGLMFDEPTSGGQHFYDGIHTNEKGAKILGAYIADEVLKHSNLIRIKSNY